jgi:hypothetical protein
MSKFQAREEPTNCDTCGGSEIELVIDSKLKRPWPYIWRCKCGAQVGCHIGTRKPLGFMAHRTIRHLRAEVHFLLDRIWKSGYVKRANIYPWLALQLELEEPDCHISELTLEQLKSSLDILERYITEHGQRIKKKEQGDDRTATKTRPNNAAIRGSQKRYKASRHGRRQD